MSKIYSIAFQFLNKFLLIFIFIKIFQIASFETSENWQMVRQFIVEQQQAALVSDGHIDSKPLSFLVETPAEIQEHFGIISTKKGKFKVTLRSKRI